MIVESPRIHIRTATAFLFSNTFFTVVYAAAGACQHERVEITHRDFKNLAIIEER